MNSAQPNLNTTLGAFEIACILSVLLFGILCAQLYTYFWTLEREAGRKIDCAVCLVWCLDLGQTICLTHGTYIATIAHYGLPDQVDFLIRVPSLPLAVLFSCLTELVVRIIFIHRIYSFTHNMWVTITCCAVSGIALLGGVLVSAEAFKTATLTQFSAQWGWLNAATLSMIVCADCLISGTLCYYLKQRKYPGRISKVIDLLIKWTIETGLLTSLTAIAQLICFQTMRRNFIYISIYSALPKLYSNSLLALLNGRTVLRRLPAGASLNVSALQDLESQQVDACRGPIGFSPPTADPSSSTINGSSGKEEMGASGRVLR